MPASNHFGNAMLDTALRGAAMTPPTRIFVSLHTGDPGSTGANEVTTDAWPAYVRKDPAAGGDIDTGFSAPDNKASENSKQMLWSDAMDGDEAITISHFAIWDDDTGGNCLFAGALYAAKTLAPTDECVIHVGDLAVTVD